MNHDPIPAQTSQRERAQILKSQVKKLRKSPDTTQMYGFRTRFCRTEYYFQTIEKRDKMMKHFPDAVAI